MSTIEFASIETTPSGVVAIVRERCESGETLAALQGVVKGYVEAIDLTHPKTGSIATMWLNEDGKYTGHAPNDFATALATFGGWRGIMAGDYIVGTVALTGFDPESGETLTLPDEWHDLITFIATA